MANTALASHASNDGLRLAHPAVMLMMVPGSCGALNGLDDQRNARRARGNTASRADNAPMYNSSTQLLEERTPMG